MAKILSESDVKFLRLLLNGKYIEAKFTEKAATELSEVLGIGRGAAKHKLRKIEEMGIVAGYAPVLSEDGLRLLEAMETAYGLIKDGKTNKGEPLSQLVEGDH